jgi:hypothetical protein
MPYSTKKEQINFYLFSLSKRMVTNPLACYGTAIVQRAVIIWLLMDASCFACICTRSLPSYKQLFKRLYSVNNWIKILMFWFIFLVRLFSFIVDSFQNNIQQIFFLFIRFVLTKWQKKSLKINMSSDSAHFHIYISYFSTNMKYIWLL